MAGLHRHLENCAPCAALAEALAETQEQVGSALPTDQEAPASLDARVMEAVRGLPARRPTWNPFSPWGGARVRFAFAAAALGLVLLGFLAGSGFTLPRLPGSRPVAAALDLAQLGEAHRRSRTPEREIHAADPRELARALTRRLRFPVVAADLPSEGARLVGGSLSAVRAVPVACLHYLWKDRPVSLFQMEAAQLTPPVLPQVAAEGDTFLVREKDGLAYVLWRTGRRSFAMVAAAEREDLFRLASSACERLDAIAAD
jgi:anti-sigma factor RsiW